jgi:hypothetical protein
MTPPSLTMILVAFEHGFEYGFRMTEISEDLTSTELQARIIDLERDNLFLNKQLCQTRKELNTLKAEVADLGRAFKTEVSNVTAEFKHDRSELKRIYRFLGDIHDQLWPLVHKVFPGSLATQRQIAAVKRGGGRSQGPNTSD